jgi:hypothetical protein
VRSRIGFRRHFAIDNTVFRFFSHKGLRELPVTEIGHKNIADAAVIGDGNIFFFLSEILTKRKLKQLICTSLLSDSYYRVSQFC